MAAETAPLSPAERFGRKDYGVRANPPEADPESQAESDEVRLDHRPCFSTFRGKHYAFAFDLCVSQDLVVSVPYSDLRPFYLVGRCELRLQFPGARATIQGRNLEPLQVALRDQKVIRITRLGTDMAAFYPDDQTVVTDIRLEFDDDEEKEADEEQTSEAE